VEPVARQRCLLGSGERLPRNVRAAHTRTLSLLETRHRCAKGWR
jgi:hypothetical protein